LSEGMLEVMEKKVAKAGLESIISCETGDCENLRFADGSFDRVTVAFGVRNFENRKKGLREMLRVLKPGGKLVILELSVPSNAFMRWLFNLYFVHILPLIGGKISGDKAAYKYLPASVLNFPGKKEFTSTLRECGYAAVSHKAFTLGICRMYSGIKP
ncbi:MAG: ubiquinone/menaquinone biosynthesis methyltransferase, partial [Candidatus Cryptobacteroides sp.]